MDQLAGVFFHMDLLDADVFGAIFSLDGHVPIHGDGRKPLGGLIGRGQVGVVVALLVKRGRAVDVAVEHHSRRHAQVDDLAVCDGKHAGHAAASGAHVGVGLGVAAVRARAEDLGFGG